MIHTWPLRFCTYYHELGVEVSGSPEDHPSWGGGRKETGVKKLCGNCHQNILLFHCENAGCHWCAACGSTVSKEKK